MLSGCDRGENGEGGEHGEKAAEFRGQLYHRFHTFRHSHYQKDKKPHPMDRMRHDLFTQGKDLITAHLLVVVSPSAAEDDNNNWS
jgi:hypothetical protein